MGRLTDPHTWLAVRLPALGLVAWSGDGLWIVVGYGALAVVYAVVLKSLVILLTCSLATSSLRVCLGIA